MSDTKIYLSRKLYELLLLFLGAQVFPLMILGFGVYVGSVPVGYPHIIIDTLWYLFSYFIILYEVTFRYTQNFSDFLFFSGRNVFMGVLTISILPPLFLCLPILWRWNKTNKILFFFGITWHYTLIAIMPVLVKGA
jgi:hypothetical protein